MAEEQHKNRSVSLVADFGCTTGTSRREPAEAHRDGFIPALDPAALDQLRRLQKAGGRSLLARVVGVYLEIAPRLLEELREAIASGADDTVRRSAHSLKSSSASVGATRLAAFCNELEILGREGRTERAPALMECLDAEYIRVAVALTAVREEAA